MKHIKIRLRPPAPAVFTSCGRIKGKYKKTLKGNKIYSFTGIPYAKPPVGNLRFRRSSPCDPWKGTLNATLPSKPSLQPNMFYPESCLRMGSEDCLYLNVYTPVLNLSDGSRNNLRPVLVFIHGGAFAVGSNDTRVFGPEVLLDENLVLVCMNYRLGPLGFLSLETESAPGNLGLHDQFLALTWVRENIINFGGDPDNVTLMGESAGAMAALLHTVSPFSSGLFHKVIALSGSPSSVFLKKNRSPKIYATALAERLGCREQDPESVLKFLQGQKVQKIMKHCLMFMDWDHPMPMPWVPIKDDFTSTPFMPRWFDEAVEANTASRVPILYCFCKDEGLLLTANLSKEPNRVDMLRKDWEVWAPLLIFHRERDIYQPEDIDAVKQIKDFYFSGTPIDTSPESMDRLKDIHSMSYFVMPMLKDAELLSSNGWKVWMMRLSVAPNFSILHVLRRPLPKVFLKLVGKSVGLKFFAKSRGVCHGDDLLYIFPFKIPGFPKVVQSEDQQFARKTFLNVISNLTRNYSPFGGLVGENHHSGDRILSIEPGCAVIEQDISEFDFRDQIQFWKSMSCIDNPGYSTEPFHKLFDKTAPYRK